MYTIKGIECRKLFVTFMKIFNMPFILAYQLAFYIIVYYLGLYPLLYAPLSMLFIYSFMY